MPPGTPFRQKTPGGPLVVYPQFLNRSPVGGQVLHGTAFRAETGINSTFSFLFLFVLFLVRPRKRTKKNGAVRHGAGFSANRLTGEYRRLCPTCEKGYTKPRCWTDKHGKTPHRHDRYAHLGQNARLGETYPLPTGRGNGDWLMDWACNRAGMAFFYQSECLWMTVKAILCFCSPSPCGRGGWGVRDLGRGERSRFQLIADSCIC